MIFESETENLKGIFSINEDVKFYSMKLFKVQALYTLKYGLPKFWIGQKSMYLLRSIFCLSKTTKIIFVDYFTERSLLITKLKVSNLAFVFDKSIKTKLLEFSDFIIFKYFVSNHECWDC